MWQEEEQIEQNPKIPDDVVDLAFSMSSGPLPFDHAELLFNAIHHYLPWFNNETQCALHHIHAAESGNGWERPEGDDALIYPSKRTKLILRLPSHRLNDAKTLENQQLQLNDDICIKLGESKSRLISVTTALYARHMLLADSNESESAFINECIEALTNMEIRFKKILAGKSHNMKIGEKIFQTRSLFIADLKIDDAFKLQQNGLGKFQHLGCGVFIPHKTIG